MLVAYRITQATGWTLQDALQIPIEDIEEWCGVIAEEQKRRK